MYFEANLSPCSGSQPPRRAVIPGLCRAPSEKQEFPSKNKLEVSRMIQGAASPRAQFSQVLGDPHAGAAVPVHGGFCSKLER